MVVGGKYRQISVENFYDKFGDVGGFSFFLLGLLDEEGQDSVEGFEEMSGIKDHFFGIFFLFNGRFFLKDAERLFFLDLILEGRGGWQFHSCGW